MSVNKWSTAYTYISKEKNLIHLIHAEKAFDKILHSFLIKSPKKLGIEKAYIIKIIYDIFIINVLNGQKTDISNKIRNNSTHIFQYFSR